MDLLCAGPVPPGSAHDVMGHLESLNFIFSPKEKGFLLSKDIVPAEEIPEGIPPLERGSPSV